MAGLAMATSNTIGDGLRRAAERFRDRPALAFADRRWSFRAVDRAADRVARYLADLGLVHGDRVCALGRNSDAYLLLWLGCVRGGFVHVPINYALAGDELDYILAQCGARALFHQEMLAEAALPARARAGVALGGTFEGAVLDAAMDGGRDGPPPNEVRDDDLAQLLYTAGTTGRSKGAMMTHRALMSHYDSCIASYQLMEGERSLAALPLYHSAQMHVCVMPMLFTGGFSHIIETPDLSVCLGLLASEAITLFFAPPTVWIGLLRHPGFDEADLSRLDKLLYGASIMPVPVLQELRRRLPSGRPFNLYGQSEIGPLATMLRPEEHDARPGSVGRPVLNVRTRVVDPAMTDCAPGVAGEIVHRSPHLLQGYWGMKEETERAFEGGWFHSGDVGTMDAEGYITVVDRMKDLINTGGVLVSSREVEEALFTHPAVAEVAVIATPDPKWIECITAVVVLRDGESLADAEAVLIAHARARLAPFKLPKHVHVADSLPKSTAGKLLKRELRTLYG